MLQRLPTGFLVKIRSLYAEMAASRVYHKIQGAIFVAVDFNKMIAAAQRTDAALRPLAVYLLGTAQVLQIDLLCQRMRSCAHGTP